MNTTKQHHDTENCPCAHCSAYRSNCTKIITALRLGDSTVEQIMKISGQTKNTVYKTLISLRKASVIERHRGGIYHLVSESFASRIQATSIKSTPNLMSREDVLDAVSKIVDKLMEAKPPMAAEDTCYWRDIKPPADAVWSSGSEFFVKKDNTISKVWFIASETEEAVKALYRMRDQSCSTTIPLALVQNPPWVSRAIKAHNIKQLDTSDKPDPMDKVPSYGQFS